MSMNTPEPTKAKVIDAVNHRETKALMRNMNAAPVARQAALGIESMKQRAMETIASVQSVTRAGLVPVAAGVAAYVGHIRQMDQRMQARHMQRGARTIHQNGIERLE